jgi:sugar phosphate isomerase/epimerase
MKSETRRQFLEKAGAFAGAAAGIFATSSRLNAAAPSMPLGVQVYDFRDLLAADFNGTWKAIAGMGYKFADMIWFAGYGSAPKLNSMSAQDVKKALTAAGLGCEICHFPAAKFNSDYAGALAYARTLGAKKVIAMPDVEKVKTIEDWKGVAKQMNALGKKVKADGFPLGYHNHEFEFTKIGGVAPYDVVMSETDPALVSFQIDLGNVRVGGGDPVSYLRKYRTRYFAVHLRDTTADGKPGVAVGAGALDWKTIFAVLKDMPVNNYVVETGAPPDKVLQAYKDSIAYVRRLNIA